MKAVKDLSLRELEELFRAATRAAKKEADDRGLPAVGFDKDGKLVSPQPDQTKQYKNLKFS